MKTFLLIIFTLLIASIFLSFESIWTSENIYPDWYIDMMDPANPHRGWSHQDYVMCTNDRQHNNNNDIPSEVFYNRFVIDTLIDMVCMPGPFGEEICECTINTKHIDDMISRAESDGKRLTFRLYFYGLFRNYDVRHIFTANSYKLEKCGFSGALGSKWDKVAKVFGPTEWVPNLQAADLKLFHGELMDSLKQYDGHPSIDFIEVGTAGHYGEWHAGNLWIDSNGDEILNVDDDYFLGAEEFAYENPDVPYSGWILEDYFNTFSETPLVMQIGGKWDRVRYRFDHVWEDIGRQDFGIRGDGFGDSGNPGYYHFDSSYSHKVYDSIFQYEHPVDKEFRYLNQWQRGPILFETGFYGYRNWLQYEKAQTPYDNTYLEQVIQQAKEYHISILNQKNSHTAGINCSDNPYYNDAKWLTHFTFSEAELDFAKERIEETFPDFLHSLGYKIHLEDWYVPPYITSVDPSSGCMSTEIQIEWNNIGVAPSYYNYYWAMKILSPGETDICTQGELHISSVSIQGVLPDFEDPEISIFPASDPIVNFNSTFPNEGSYKIFIALVEPGGEDPKIILANDNITSDPNCLWYCIGNIDVNETGDIVLESPQLLTTDMHYETNGRIESEQLIGDSNLPTSASENAIDVIYEAGGDKEVVLSYPFEIAKGVSFSAFLEGCID